MLHKTFLIAVEQKESTKRSWSSCMREFRISPLEPIW